MEQYFEITKDSNHYQEYIDFQSKRKSAIKAIDSFSEAHGINSNGFMIWDGYFWVAATDDVVKKFSNQLRNIRYKGCCAFKKNSSIGKAFAESGITMPSKPFVPFFFPDCPGYGDFSTRLFEYSDRVYCSIAEPTLSALKSPTGFIEMKASEFFKIIEEAEGRNNDEHR